MLKASEIEKFFDVSLVVGLVTLERMLGSTQISRIILGDRL
jgi:hypothetical protein